MDTFAPEFSRFWLSLVSAPRDGERRVDERADEALRHERALEELTERVNAARCIV